MHRKVSAILPAMALILTNLVLAADPDVNVLKKSGSLDRLFKKTGVYNASSNREDTKFCGRPRMAAGASK